jgi:predicted MFS family arabinose efflux permease
MHDVGFSPRTLRPGEIPGEMRRVANESIRHGWHRRPIRLLMFVSFLQWGFMSWGFYAWQPYFLELLGRDAVWAAGAAASAFAGAMIAGNAIVDRLSSFCGRRTTLLLWAGGLQSGAAVVVGLTESFWIALASMIVLAAGLGMTGPVKQAYLHASVASSQRATVVSFDSMFGNGGGVVGQAGLGWVSRARSIEDGYVLGGLATALALPLLWGVRAIGGTPDVIVGERAGVSGPCAAQGIPEVAGVDAKARSGAVTSPTA